MTRPVTSSLMGDPPPGRTPWSTPAEAPRPTGRRPHAPDLSGSARAAPVEKDTNFVSNPQPGALAASENSDNLSEISFTGEDNSVADHIVDADDMVPPTLRPVVPICIQGIEPGAPPTGEPMIEWMAPSDLLVDGAYQRDLSDKSIKLIRRIVEHWDWRRFKPPVVAWTEAGFEIIDGQHTAIAAATHPTIERIPVLVVEASELKDRASAFIGHNRDRLAVSAVQMHQAAATAGDEDAVTVNQVCERAGVRLVTGAWGGYAWQAGETVAVSAVRRLIDQRGAQKARMVLQALCAAGCAPITVHDIKAADLLFHSADFAGDLEPLPVGGEDLAQAIRNLGANGPKEAREYAALKCLPLWKAQAAVWFKKTRKRRRSA